MTVDPAPRLLDALGLGADSTEPVEVHLETLPHSRRSTNTHRARLRALRLDPKRTFDSIIGRYATSHAARDTILENRIYRNLSNALAGVADYMAMEKMLELASNRATDLVVLDTPPAAEAIDFLDAPRRLLELLNSRAISLLGAPSGIAQEAIAPGRYRGAGRALGVRSGYWSQPAERHPGLRKKFRRHVRRLRRACCVGPGESSRPRHGNCNRDDRGGEPNRTGARIYRSSRARGPARRRVGRKSCDGGDAGWRGDVAGKYFRHAQEKTEAKSRRLSCAQDSRGNFAERAARLAAQGSHSDGRAGSRPRAAYRGRPGRGWPESTRAIDAVRSAFSRAESPVSFRGSSESSRRSSLMLRLSSCELR